MTTNDYFRFRFGLYGRRSGGKTSYVTALALPHVSTPPGVRCKPALDAAVKEKRRRRKDAFNIDFDAWEEVFKTYKDALDKGETPPATSISNVLLGARFLVTTGGSIPVSFVSGAEMRSESVQLGSFLVDTADYSGELIDPRLRRNQIARRLRSWLADLDGLIVMAEAPGAGEDSQWRSEEISQLELAITLLAAEARSRPFRSTPVVLAINKWDRFSRSFDQREPEAQTRKLVDFLNEPKHSSHRQLCELLSNLVGPENFAAVPVSAFGPSSLKDVGGYMMEVPERVGGSLNSFGLETPLLFLAARCDALNMERMQASWSAARSWKLWDVGAGGQVKPSPDAMIGRFEHFRAEPGASRAETAKAVKKSMISLGLRQAAVIAAALAIAPPLGFLYYDSQKIERLSHVQEIFVHDLSEARDLLNWTESYSKDWPYIRLFSRLKMSQDDAFKTLDDMKSRFYVQDVDRVAAEEKSLHDRLEGAAAEAVEDLLRRTTSLSSPAPSDRADADLKAKFASAAALQEAMSDRLRDRLRQVVAAEKLPGVWTLVDAGDYESAISELERYGDLIDLAAVMKQVCERILSKLDFQVAQATTLDDRGKVWEDVRKSSESSRLRETMERADPALAARLDETRTKARANFDETLYAEIRREFDLFDPRRGASDALRRLLDRYVNVSSLKRTGEVVRASDYVRRSVATVSVQATLTQARFNSSAEKYKEGVNYVTRFDFKESRHLASCKLGNGAEQTYEFVAKADVHSIPPLSKALTVNAISGRFDRLSMRCSMTCETCAGRSWRKYSLDYGSSETVIPLDEETKSISVSLSGANGGASDLIFTFAYDAPPPRPILPDWR